VRPMTGCSMLFVPKMAEPDEIDNTELGGNTGGGAPGSKCYRCFR